LILDIDVGDSIMNMVQESFLRWLHNQRNHERLNNYIVYDGYYNGDHEVDIPPKVKAALRSELGTICNYCRVVVDRAVDYICGGEIGIEVKCQVPLIVVHPCLMLASATNCDTVFMFGRFILLIAGPKANGISGIVVGFSQCIILRDDHYLLSQVNTC
jgi:hypothetical protein